MKTVEAIKTWVTEKYTYVMIKNNPYGYRIDKYDNKTGELLDFAIGSTEYALSYWFENVSFRIYDKDF